MHHTACAESQLRGSEPKHRRQIPYCKGWGTRGGLKNTCMLCAPSTDSIAPSCQPGQPHIRAALVCPSPLAPSLQPATWYMVEGRRLGLAEGGSIRGFSALSRLGRCLTLLGFPAAPFCFSANGCHSSSSSSSTKLAVGLECTSTERERTRRRFRPGSMAFPRLWSFSLVGDQRDGATAVRTR